MDEKELTEFLYLFFGVGIVVAVYYPAFWALVLPIFALIGGFYLVWGVLSRLTSTFTRVGFARRDDWWNGLAILIVVVMIYARPDLAMQAIVFIVALIFWALAGFGSVLSTLAHA